MATGQMMTNSEMMETTQNAVFEAANTVAQVVENVEHEVSGHGGAYYENPEFWVGLAFVLVVLMLARPIGRILNLMLNKRIEAIADRITEAQKHN